MKSKVDKGNAVIAFDIRNFSAHRHLLGKVTGGGTILTSLVRNLLNDAVEILKSRDEKFPSKKSHFLNHTGDGFILIVRGDKSSLLALLWISEFRDQAEVRIEEYQREMKKQFSDIEKKLPRLDFGIGAHFGTVVSIEFHNFESQATGVLGSSINIASRVEQCTKDHDCNVLFTNFLLKKAKEIIPTAHQNYFDRFWKSLGKHRLRGFGPTYTFHAFEPGFHRAWSAKIS